MKIVHLLLAMTAIVGCNEEAEFHGTPPQNSEPLQSEKSEVEQQSADVEEADVPEGAVDDGEFALLEIEFPAASWSPRSQTVSLDRSFVEHQLTLMESLQTVRRNEQQESRPAYMDRFTQGHVGQSMTESFSQKASGVIDLLVVIDNSSSMKQEQANLASKLEPLLKHIDFAEWQIGVITTDPKNSCMRDLIRKGDPKASQRFSKAIKAGLKGSSDEMGIRRAVEGLKGECLSEAWVRPNSSVGVLIVSDEDNCSDRGNDCKGDPWASHEYLVDYLNSIRTVGEDARVYGLIWHPKTPVGRCRTAQKKGYEYSYAIEATGGDWGSICQKDYSSTLSRISLDVSKILKKDYELKHAPDRGSLQVYLDNRLQSSGFQIMGKIIHFDEPPKENVQIQFKYQYDAEPIKKRFVLKEQAHDTGFQVFVNNVELNRSLYKFLDSSNELEFKQVPADDASIRVNYKKKMTLNSNFQLDSSARDLDVAVGSTQVENFRYNSSTGVLSFEEPPQEGVELEFSYVLATPVQEYAFEPVFETAEELHIVDASEKGVRGWSFAQGKLVFTEDEFEVGRQLSLRYLKLDEQFEESLWTGQSTIVPSLEVYLDDHLCKSDNLKLAEDGRLQVNCPLKSARTLVAKYDVVDYWMNEVTVPNVRGTADELTWKVYVNDVQTDLFERDGARVMFSNLLWDDIVKITVSK